MLNLKIKPARRLHTPLVATIVACGREDRHLPIAPLTNSSRMRLHKRLAPAARWTRYRSVTAPVCSFLSSECLPQALYRAEDNMLLFRLTSTAESSDIPGLSFGSAALRHPLAAMRITKRCPDAPLTTLRSPSQITTRDIGYL